MAAKAVVADAGPLIAFGRIARLDLLPGVLGRVLVPEAVLAETLVDLRRPAAQAIDRALADGLLVRAADPEPASPPFLVLDAGESAAVRLALELSIPALIDEKAGRKIAANLGVAVIGSGGVLLAAKKHGLIDCVAPFLELFRTNGYHLSETLVQGILRRAKEP